MKIAGQRLKFQAGLVGLFDILGYQSFLENNRGRAGVEPVFNFFLNLEETVPTIYRQLLELKVKQRMTQQRVDNCLKKIEWLIFADTILRLVSRICG